VLGNKCAGQYNLKRVHFKEALASGNFLVWLLAICVFFCGVLSTPGRQQQAILDSVVMVRVTPYKLFLMVPWVNKDLASSDFTFRKR
jgi:hypothetical protein